jgi:hypothetical protein
VIYLLWIVRPLSLDYQNPLALGPEGIDRLILPCYATHGTPLLKRADCYRGTIYRVPASFNTKGERLLCGDTLLFSA